MRSLNNEAGFGQKKHMSYFCTSSGLALLFVPCPLVPLSPCPLSPLVVLAVLVLLLSCCRLVPLSLSFLFLLTFLLLVLQGDRDTCSAEGNRNHGGILYARRTILLVFLQDYAGQCVGNLLLLSLLALLDSCKVGQDGGKTGLVQKNIVCLRPARCTANWEPCKKAAAPYRPLPGRKKIATSPWRCSPIPCEATPVFRAYLAPSCSIFSFLARSCPRLPALALARLANLTPGSMLLGKAGQARYFGPCV